MARRSDNRWDAHPVLAWWVRVAVLLVPLVASLLTALAVIALLPRPGSATEHLLWWVAVVGSAFLAAQLVERWARRALPLAVLLRLALVFPDQAPSRLRAARRTSLREIEREVAALREGADIGEPAEAARRLVALVGALGMHDKRTRGHSERVRAYVDMLTEELDLPEDARIRLRWAALLHDIGKLSVPGPVLNGGRDLDEDEWAALRRHPLEGERLAAGLLPWLGEWGTCVREHHERWDGSGYPAGLAGTEISLGARIVAVADAYEVMTANRTYQASISPAAAREELARCAGKDFDPAVVRAFLGLSIGRLRGVLGPLSFLPAVPLAAASDRAGDVARGLTTVAAVSAVALAAPAASGALPVPPDRWSAPDAVVPSSAPLVTPTPTPTPTPSPRAVPAPSPSTVPHVVAARAAAAPPPAAPAPLPAALSRVLYLAPSGLLQQAAPAGQLAVPRGGSPLALGVAVPSDTALAGTQRLAVVHRLGTRHGGGLPRAVLSASLLDCGAGGCRTLAAGSLVLRPQHRAWSRQQLTLRTPAAVVPAGHELRLVLRVTAQQNVTGVLLACGGTTTSRLLLA